MAKIPYDYYIQGYECSMQFSYIPDNFFSPENKHAWQDGYRDHMQKKPMKDIDEWGKYANKPEAPQCLKNHTS